jgi:hypothetical protein
MKKLLLILCLFSITARAEVTTLTCIGYDNWTMTVKFDTNKKVLWVNDDKEFKASITSNDIRWSDDSWSQNINRSTGVLNIYDKRDEKYLTRTLNCSVARPKF